MQVVGDQADGLLEGRGLGTDSEPESLEEAVGLIADDLLARVSPAAPDRAVSQPPSEAPEGGSGTALGRVLRRLTDQR